MGQGKITLRGKLSTQSIFGVNREDLLPSFGQMLIENSNFFQLCILGACNEKSEFSCSVGQGQVWFRAKKWGLGSLEQVTLLLRYRAASANLG